MMRWKALYSDGTFLEQQPGTSLYPQIDRTKLVGFQIIDEKSGRLVAMLHLEPGQRLIYRSIGVKQFNMGTQEQSDGPKTIMCGWQQTIGGKNIQSILYITPDGTVHQTGKFVGIAPNLRPEEMQIG